MPSEIRPIIPNVAIPPNIPPGPKAANAVVIAAPPASPVAPIALPILDLVFLKQQSLILIYPFTFPSTLVHF